MKKYNFKINGNKYEVELQDSDNNRIQVDVNGTSYNVELEEKITTTKTPILVRTNAVPSTENSIPKTSKPSEPKGAGVIKAPIPGVILQVTIKEGDVVKIGDKILVMEAMKMENNINADKEGKVTKVKVKQGDNVLEGDILVEIGG